MRAGMKSNDFIRRVQFRQVRVLRVVVRVKKYCRARMLRMRGSHSEEIDIQHCVAVHHQEHVVQLIECVDYGSRSSVRNRIAVIANVDSPACAIPEIALDRFGTKTGKDQYVRDLVPGGKQNLVLDQRLVPDLYEAFREVCRTLREPRPFSASDDNQLHGSATRTGRRVAGESHLLPGRLPDWR